MSVFTPKSSKPSPPVETPAWKTDSRVFAELALQGGQRAVRKAIAEHHRAGDPVAIWRDGRIVELFPDGSIRPIEPTEP